jgi:hypothetical protein
MTVEYLPLGTTAKRKQEAADRLRELNFNPVNELVNKFRELEEELDYLRKRRDGLVNVMNPNTGRIINVRNEDLLGVFKEQISISKELLRYKYSRVSEGITSLDEEVPPLIINLAQKTSNGN